MVLGVPILKHVRVFEFSNSVEKDEATSSKFAVCVSSQYDIPRRLDITISKFCTRKLSSLIWSLMD